jgi:hypothetical protein
MTASQTIPTAPPRVQDRQEASHRVILTHLCEPDRDHGVPRFQFAAHRQSHMVELALSFPPRMSGARGCGVVVGFML